MVRYRRPWERLRPVVATAASRAGLQAAQAALLEPAGEPVTAEQYLAQREQWRREDEARRSAQGCLELRT